MDLNSIKHHYSRKRPTASVRRQHMLQKEEARKQVEREREQAEQEREQADREREQADREREEQADREREEAEREREQTERERDEDTHSENANVEDIEVDDARDTFPGGPIDASILCNFRTHVAAAIWKGQERVLRCHCLTTKLLKWPYTNDPSSALWITLVKRSKLMCLRTMSYKGPNRNLISAFVERWQPETNSFHMPFGEMTITLDDVHCLTGLNITGRIVKFGGGDDDEESGSGIICHMLGVDSSEASIGVSEKCGSAVKLNWLLKKFSSTISTDDEIVALHGARAFLLYTLGCTIFTDKTGDRVSTHYLKLFEDPEEFGSYAWGTAALAFLYRQLGLSSQANVRQISGYLTLLEVWIYEHFPTIIRPQRNVDYRSGQPLILRWAQQTHAGGSESSVQAFRELLDDLKPEHVVWDLYSTFVNGSERPDVAFYEGCITAGHVVEPYLPDRVLRQFGLVQKIPRTPLVPELARASKKIGQQRLMWGCLATYFEEWESHKLSQERRGMVANVAWKCVPEYLSWYHRISHPRIQNPVNSTGVGLAHNFEIGGNTHVKSALDYLSPVVTGWGAGNVTHEYAMMMVEEAYEVLRASMPSYQPTSDL